MSLIKDMSSFMTLLMDDKVWNEYSKYVFDILDIACWKEENIKEITSNTNIKKTLGVINDEIVYKSLCAVIALKAGADSAEKFKSSCESMKQYSMKFNESVKLQDEQVLEIFKAASALVLQEKEKIEQTETEEVNEDEIIDTYVDNDEYSEEEVQAALEAQRIKELVKDDEYIYFEDEDTSEIEDYDDENEYSEEEIQAALKAQESLNEKKNTEEAEAVKEDPAPAAESDQDRLKVVEETWHNDVESTVDGLLKVYKVLYESCYDVGKPAGILIKDGIFRTKTDGKITLFGDAVTNKRLFLAINRALNGFGFDRYIAKGNSPVKEPDIKDLVAAKGPVTLYGMHLQFMFGHRRYCRGLDQYLKDCKSGFNSDRVTTWSTMEGYIRHSLKSYIYKALADSGLGADVDEKSLDIEQQVLECMSLSLKNVIVVCDSTKGQNTELRICAGQQIRDVPGFLRNLEKSLNNGNTVTTKVKQVGSYENGILDVNIIYNEQRYMDASLYAHEVLDSLIDQGIQPSWSKVIMGKGLDGKTYYHNFRNEKAPVYCLYASSRSGKGVMTLNLIASALADGCKVMYTDAKPDTANILAEIAWKNGKEAAIINGVPAFSKDLESLPGSPRNDFSFRGINDIPRIIFPDGMQLQQFYRLTQYYRALEVVGELAAKRKEQDIAKNGSAKDWLVCIFDEIQNLAEIEAQLREQMSETKSELQKQIKEETKGKDPSPDPDKIAAVEYIKNYDSWIKGIQVKWQNGKTINFGKANMTIIFIWQTSNFPFNDQKKASISGLSQLVKSFDSAVKMMGRAAVAGGGLTAFGNTQTLSKMTWYDEKFSGEKGGFFAICNAALNEGRAKVIRPYNIYGDDKGRDLIINAAKVNGFTPDDLLGSSLYKDNTGEYKVIPEVGFEGYARKLLGKFGLDTATQINLAYEYVDGLVKEFTGGQAGFLDYMYSAHIGLNSYKEDTGLQQLSEAGEQVVVSDQAVGLNENTAEEEPQSIKAVEDVQDGHESLTGKNDEPTKNEMRFSIENLDKLIAEEGAKAKQEQTFSEEEMAERINNLMKKAEVTAEEIKKQNKREKTPEEIYEELMRKQEEAMYSKPIPLSQASKVLILSRASQTYKNFNGKPIYINSKVKNENFEVETPKNTISSKFRFTKKSVQRLVNSIKGPQYELSSIFEELLKGLEQTGFALNKVVSLILVDGNMYVNGRYVDTGNLINYDDSNLTVCDVVDYKLIKKYLRNVREMTVDYVAYESLELTSGALKQDSQFVVDFMFKGLHELQKMVIIDASGKQHLIGRQRYSNENFSDLKEMQDTSSRLRVASVSRNATDSANIAHTAKLRMNHLFSSVQAKGQQFAENANVKRLKQAAGIAGKAGAMWLIGSTLTIPLVLPATVLGYTAWNIKKLMNVGKKN